MKTPLVINPNEVNKDFAAANQSLETLRALRAWNLVLHARFITEDWLTEVQHPERVSLLVDLMVWMLARHNLNQLGQLGQIAEG